MDGAGNYSCYRGGKLCLVCCSLPQVTRLLPNKYWSNAVPVLGEERELYMNQSPTPEELTMKTKFTI